MLPCENGCELPGTKQKPQTTANTRQTATVASRVNKKMVRGLQSHFRWFCHARQKPSCVTSLKWAYVTSSSQWPDSIVCHDIIALEEVFMLEGALVYAMGGIIFLARTMLHCEPMAQMAHPLCHPHPHSVLIVGPQTHCIVLLLKLQCSSLWKDEECNIHSLDRYAKQGPFMKNACLVFFC